MIYQIAAAALLLAQTTAPTAPPPPSRCLTTAEIGATGAVLMPFFIDGAARKCAAALPADAFLKTGASDFAGRLRSENEGAGAAALGMMEIFTGTPMPELANKDAMLQVMGEMLATALLEKLETGKCGQIDRLFRGLSPLQSENLQQILGSILALSGAGRDGIGADICEE